MFKHAEKMKRNALRLHIPKHVLNPASTTNLTKKSPRVVKTPKLRVKKEETKVSSKKNESRIDDVQQLHNSSTSTSLSKVRGSGLTLSISIAPSFSAATIAQAAPSSAVSISSVSSVSKHRRGTFEDAEYLIGPQKSVHRRRVDPRVSMSTILHDIIAEIIRTIEGAETLMYPVSAKNVPDYYNIIKRPMNLQQIRKNIAENRYELRRQFLEDLMLVLTNSTTYNGTSHTITQTAQRIMEIATKRVEENEQKLIRLEKSINPLLDDDDIVGFSHILLGIVAECKNLPKSVAFHSKVDLKKFPKYTEMVSKPMDLGTIEQNIKTHKYMNVNSFLHDIEQIHINSQLFNGTNSPYTEKAAEIVELAQKLLEASHDNLAELEVNIQKTLGEIDDSASVVSGYSTATELMGVSIPMSAGYDTNAKPVKNVGNRNAQQDFGATFYIGEGDVNDDDSVMVQEAVRNPDTFQEDLAMNNDEMMDEEASSYEWNATRDLLESQMQLNGQLNADLALSESDEDEELLSAKRSKLDEEFGSSL